MLELRGRPVGVILFDIKAAHTTNVMRVRNALSQCPDMVLVTHWPDLYRHAHSALLNEITYEISVDSSK
ncbi:hypothetical protein [Hyphomonas atlantica corrig.]|uniref:hypothetical protein n=1 Tax=Hyphomonas atlantica TaxID=1280948 RepID=UPI002356A5EC|nr:hypothetical protein [Hyphomonas atlantica]